MTKPAKYMLLALAVFALASAPMIALAQDAAETDENIEANDLDTSDPSVLPDNPLYFFKNLGRQIRLLFAFDPVDKAELRERFSNEKLVELKKMVEQNKNANAIKNAAENYESELESMKQFAERIRETAQENEEVGKFLDKFTQHQTLHQTILQKLEEQVPEEVLEKIKEVREQHLERFSEVMQKLEDEDKISDRIEKNLQQLRGSDFKEFKNLEFLNELKEKLPEDVQKKIEETKETILNNLRERLENLPEEQQKKFQEYTEKISGDEENKLNIIDALKGTELSEKLNAVIEQVRERHVESIESRYENAITEEKAKAQVEEAKETLEKAKSLVVQTDATNAEMPEVFRLIEQAEKQFALAEEYLGQQEYAKAYAHATSAISLAKNAIRIMEIRAGFTEPSTSSVSACADISSPVCGEDNETYENICLAKQAGVEISYRGECKAQAACAKEGEKVNRNPLLGATSQVCCEGLEEARVSKSYSYCRREGTTYECETSFDCPLSRCAGAVSQCIDNKCVIPRCKEPEVCIQVITPAKNPSTGECKEFPTPCDVPEGWETVSACATSLKSMWQEQVHSQLKANQ